MQKEKMKSPFDAKLKEQKEKVLRQQKLSVLLKELYRQQTEYSIQVADLEEMMQGEQTDVEKLEGRSLTAFFYTVLGTREEKLEKERKEALAAKVKYDSAAKELQAVEQEIARCEAELDSLLGCQKVYEDLLEQKKAQLTASGSAAGQRILRLEEQIAGLQAQEKEVEEALLAGQDALDLAYQAGEKLMTAQSWGTWDLLGGGVLVDLVKHSQLDEAQALIEQLQSQLRLFRSELSDIPAQATFQVNVAGFLRFADYFFDGLFADWTVQQHIAEGINQVDSIIKQIKRTLERLESIGNTVRTKTAELQQNVAKLILEE